MLYILERRPTYWRILAGKVLSPSLPITLMALAAFNNKVYGLAHNLRPLEHWRNLEQLRLLAAYAPPGFSGPADTAGRSKGKEAEQESQLSH